MHSLLFAYRDFSILRALRASLDLQAGVDCSVVGCFCNMGGSWRIYELCFLNRQDWWQIYESCFQKFVCLVVDL